MASWSFMFSKCKVKINGKVSGEFEMSTGVRQGNGLSPTVFNTVVKSSSKS